jgi:hypothetical protein
MRLILAVILALLAVALSATEPVGRWTFDNANDLTDAAIGTDLTLVGTHEAVSGPAADNGAVRIGPGSFYRCYHNIPANGGGSWVNEYSLMIDFKVPSIGVWYCFFQTNYQNTNDGEAFINTAGQLGVAATGYSLYTILPNEWYRLIISADLGSGYKYYLDGQLLQDGGAQILDGRFSLYPQGNQNQVLFFADDNAEDNLIDIAEVRVYDVPLSPTEAASLDGYGHDVSSGPAAMLPFLQSPTPTSVYVSWHCATQGISQVFYGTSPDQLTQTQAATTQVLSAGIEWHTAKLENLTPGTRYYYRCQTNTDQSDICTYKTVPAAPTEGHFRFIILGDSQSNPGTSSWVVSKIAQKCEELYGENWRDEIGLIAHVGDITSLGLTLNNFPPQFFVPFAPLSSSIPINISIGNHEAESSNYYNYMHYEDFGGPEGEKYYSLDLAGCRFIFLNGNITTTQELPWFQQKLTDALSNQNIGHVFTFIHQPGHSEVWPDGNYSFTQNSVIPALDGCYKATLLASGHSHNYEHSTSRDSRLHRFITGGGGGDLDRWGMYANQTNYEETYKSLDHNHWLLVDVDRATHIIYGRMFSLGTPDLRRDNEMMDEWTSSPYYTDPPRQPDILDVKRLSGNRLQMTLSMFHGFGGAFFSIGGELTTDANPETVLYSYFKDAEDIYGDTGAPHYEPVDLNAGMDRRRVVFENVVLNPGEQYHTRGWYRNHLLDWAISETDGYVDVPYSPSCDFIAVNPTAETGDAAIFTDLSAADITSWAWDFQNDGIVDSTERDPVYYYSQPGTYTVSLTILTEQGLMTETKVDYIHFNPVAVSDPLDTPLLRDLTHYPNPFSNASTVVFQLRDASPVSVDVFNARGQLVRTLFAGDKPSGEHHFSWDGRDDSGQRLPRGVYLYRISAGTVSIGGKTLLLK